MQQLAQVYHENTELSFREQLEQQDNLFKYYYQDPQEKINEKLFEMGMPTTHDDLEYIEHRVYHDYVGTVDFDLKDPSEGARDKSWAPYEQDLSQYPEVFKRYQENYAKYDKARAKFQQEDLTSTGEGKEPFEQKLPVDMSPWEKKYDDLMPRFTGTSCQ